MFAERFRLRRNWLNGYCNVRTFEGHTQGGFTTSLDAYCMYMQACMCMYVSLKTLTHQGMSFLSVHPSFCDSN